MTRIDSTHSTYLDDVIKNVADFGAALVPYHLLYRWYETPRLTKKVWEDLITRFEELLEKRKESKDGYVLGYIDHARDDILTLVCLDAKAASCKSDTVKPLSSLF